MQRQRMSRKPTAVLLSFTTLTNTHPPLRTLRTTHLADSNRLDSRTLSYPMRSDAQDTIVRAGQTTGVWISGPVNLGPGKPTSRNYLIKSPRGSSMNSRRSIKVRPNYPSTFSVGLKQWLGSPEELEDLRRAYNDTDGSLDEIMNHIPHSTIDDEPRFVRLITNFIKSGNLASTRTWEKSVKDETARLKRKKKSAKEAEEAEALAKEIGVWDEFYDSGKPTNKAAKKQKGKQKANVGDEEEGDVSALQALILKRKKNMDGFFNNLAAKYAEPEPSVRSGGSRGKKRKADASEDPSTKKSKTVPPPPDIDDEEFARIQESLLKKAPASPKPRSTSKGEAKRKAKVRS